MRSILVQAGRDAGMGARLDTAMALARGHGGHLTVLVDTPIDRYVTVDPYGGAILAREALEIALQEDDALAAAFGERLARDDVPFDVAQSELPQIDALVRGGDLADLIVVSRSSGLAGDLALNASCPVLALPDHAPLQWPPETACLAWDGSSEAARALKAAIPLLAEAREVLVLTVERDQANGFPPTEALRYLGPLQQASAVTRDRVIFSVGFGRSPHGRVLSDLGALSTSEGLRLVAVAVTRANHHLTVISSLTTAELREDRMSDGARALGEFIDDTLSYVPPTTANHPLLDDLGRRLEQRGALLIADVPGIPLAARIGDECIAIDIDDNLMALSLREGLRIRPAMLARCGWKYSRVHELQLFLSPDIVADRLIKEIRGGQTSA